MNGMQTEQQYFDQFHGEMPINTDEYFDWRYGRSFIMEEFARDPWTAMEWMWGYTFSKDWSPIPPSQRKQSIPNEPSKLPLVECLFVLATIITVIVCFVVVAAWVMGLL